MNKGMLVVIEGACDGIGKTTQFNMLIDKLKKDGIKIYTHHFPSYGTVQGARVEKFLKGEYGNPGDLSPYFVNELYAYDRFYTWENELKKYYDDGYLILLDRYTTSSIIYQSVFIKDKDEKNKFIDYVIKYEYEENKIKKPDLVIFLKAPYDLVRKLKNSRIDNEGIVNDVYEKDDILMEDIYNNAIYISNYLNWNIVDCSDGNNFKDKDTISEEVYRLVKKKIKKSIDNNI